MATATGEVPSQLPSAPSQPASRFGQVGEQTSGHATPSPGIPALQPTTQVPNPQQTAAHQQYPMQPGAAYYHPGYYYMNQYPQAAYYPFGKQQGVYQQPQPTYMNQYEHASSPAGLAGFGGPATQGRDAATAAATDYSRTAVSQAQQSHPQHLASNYSGLPNFLNSRGLPEQQQLGPVVGQQQVGQQGQSDDNLKPFGDNKPPTGPASGVALQGQPRPGSATSGASSLPQQANQPQGGIGYPHANHHLHGHQAHQQSQQHSAAQGQAYGQQYNAYGQYPNQYSASSGRQGSNWGGYGGGHATI